jgi:hypothetical protein
MNFVPADVAAAIATPSAKTFAFLVSPPAPIYCQIDVKRPAPVLELIDGNFILPPPPI